MSELEPKYIDAFASLSKEGKIQFMLRVAFEVSTQARLFYINEKDAKSYGYSDHEISQQKKNGYLANEIIQRLISESLGLMNEEIVYPDDVLCRILFETAGDSPLREVLDLWFGVLVEAKENQENEENKENPSK